MEGASNSGASDTPTDYHAAPRTGVPAFSGGSTVDSTSQGDILRLQTVAPAQKKRGHPRKYRSDRSLNLAMSPKPTSSSIGKAAKFEFQKQGQLLASSVCTIINLDPDEDTIVSPKKLIHEDQTQHPQEVEHQVSEATTFTPRVITVNVGENVTMKVMSLCQQGPEAICILSAIGVISSATISQPQSSEKLSTYEGKYEIISLSGSFMPKESRSGSMSVSLMGLDGHVVEGCVAGPLVAASPVKVVVGNFLANEQHEQKLETQKNEVTSTVTPTATAPVSTAGQLLATSVGATLTPHIIIVNAGEDVTMKVKTFCPQRHVALRILSVNGVTSRATINRPQASGTLYTYEGRYEIQSLSGRFMPMESRGRLLRAGGMNVSLVDLDGHVVAGRIAGPLVAESLVKVMVITFLAREQHMQKNEVISTIMPTTAAPALLKIPSSSWFDEDTSNNSIDLNL